MGKAFRDNRAVGLGHKCVTEEGELKNVQICVTSFMNAPLQKWAVLHILNNDAFCAKASKHR